MIEENQHEVHPQKFKFFRIMLSGFSKKLAIPQRLTKCFIRQNLRFVTLLSPLNTIWNIKISGDSKDLYFVGGWERFTVAHELSFGDLLVFKHVGSMVFNVTIFDKTTCEKEYKIANIGVCGDDHLHGHQENYDQKEYSGCFKKQTTPTSGHAMMGQESNTDQPQGSPCRGKRPRPKPVHHKAKEATKEVYKKRGSHFEITISPKCKFFVNIPTKFARSNDLSSIHQMLLIRDSSGGRRWPVKLLHYKRSAGHDYFLFTTGWRDFCVRNDVKDGDVCFFQFKKKNEIFVQIRRSCEKDDSKRSKSLRQAVHLKGASPSKVTHASKPADPTQFRSTIVPTNVRKTGGGGYMTIPRAFLSLVDLSDKKDGVLVDPNSRRWPVKIHHYYNKCVMSHGWIAFCEENNVEVDDICVFNFKYKEREHFVRRTIWKLATSAVVSATAS